jgi:hypothetical protein
MRPGSPRLRRQRPRMTSIAWGLATVLFCFTAENLWIDPWLRQKSPRIPSLVPQALSGAWFLSLAVGGIALLLLVVCQILLTRDRNLAAWTKVGTGIAVLGVLLLSVQWFRITNKRPALRLRSSHTVLLTWKASSSQVAGYNVYRSTTPAANYVRINSSPVQGLTFTDDTVESGSTYYYVTRAVDRRGQESNNSNEARATIP